MNEPVIIFDHIFLARDFAEQLIRFDGDVRDVTLRHFGARFFESVAHELGRLVQHERSLSAAQWPEWISWSGSRRTSAGTT